jgi:D-beta-D-heptose 7-phosphate kinase/D-beta-D-heptose 1-phosphate adenosyltransferase
MKKIFVNGSFDVLHRGHIELLKYARRQGDFLVVAIDTDERIRYLKGTLRPINNQWDRKFVLENLRAVDDVCLFSSDAELVALIKEYAPDVMVKGSDYIGKNIIGAEYCKEIKFYDRTEHSTTKTIQDIITRG